MNKKIESLVEYLETKGITKDEVQPYLSQIEKDLKSKKYGLVWEEQQENIYENLKNNFPILKEVEENEIKTDDNDLTNILIEGDNLESLTALQYTHKNKIDVIYIDPPYNTGNSDFRYNDRFIDKEHVWRHSSWLSFMDKRLRLAKDLLHEDGLIFISIDDNEFAQLKLLCDDIFGEQNFISNIVWRKTGQQQNNGKNIAIVTEYIVCYAKKLILDNNKKRNVLNRESILDRKGISAYKYEDENGRFRLNPIQDKSTGKHEYTLINPNTNEKIHSCYWRISEDKYYELASKNLIYWTTKLPNKKKYLDVNQGVLPISFIDGIYNEEGNLELKNILGINKFDYPKPINLIKKILSLSTKKNDTILDFFAGSGTTGHAVLELNNEDKGNRQFILCTNNEKSICEEVTYQRLDKVMNGYKTLKGKEIKGLGGNLKYYRTKKIEKTNNTELDQFNLLNKTLELIQIKENTFNIDKTNDYYTLLNNNEKIIGLYLFGFIDSIKIENMLDELLEDNRENKVAYVPVEDISELYDYIDSKYIDLVRFEKMPKELIEIYNKLNRN